MAQAREITNKVLSTNDVPLKCCFKTAVIVIEGKICRVDITSREVTNKACHNDGVTLKCYIETAFIVKDGRCVEEQ